MAKKISQLTQVTPTPSAMIPILQDSATAKSKVEDLLNAIVPKNASARNSVYRNKNLGSSVTEEQFAAIAAGTFDNLFLGDHWVIDGVTWVIAGFNYWNNTGYPKRLNKNHVVVVPGSNIVSGKLNNAGSTSDGYTGTDFYTGNNSNTAKADADAIIKAAFGADHILTHREYLVSAVTDGLPSTMTWADSTFELMTEEMVFGNSIAVAAKTGSTNPPDQSGVCNGQLPLFAIDHQRIGNGGIYWLRNIVSSTRFVLVDQGGNRQLVTADTSRGIRPAVGIIGA